MNHFLSLKHCGSEGIEEALSLYFNVKAVK